MRFRPLLIVLGLTAFCAAVRADEEELPSVNILPCDPSCANSTRAKRLNAAAPIFPSSYLGDYVEAFVQIRYTVGVDGTVHDVDLLQLIGPPTFARYVIERAQDWKFEPATLNGKPVEQSLVFDTIFRVENSFGPGARPDTINRYAQAASLLKSGKIDEAQSKLDASLSRPELNFYERGMLSLLSATIAAQKGDFEKLHDLTTVPTQFFANELPANALQYLLKFRIEAALRRNDIVDALAALSRLQQVKGFDAKDPIVDLVSKTRAQLAQQDLIAVDARIPDAAKGEEFGLRLFRRDIGFQHAAGLGRFIIDCNQGVVASQVSENAQWHIPRDWNNCAIFVHGAPGTTFQLLEFSPSVAEPVPAR